jgi:hypothetical protein
MDILSAITAAVATTTAAVSSSIATNLPVIMVVFGGLVALGIIMRFIKRLIGRRA